MSISITAAIIGILSGLLVGVLSSVSYYFETRSKMYGRPGYVSHQYPIYTKSLPVGILLLFISASGKRPLNVYVCAGAVVSLIIIIIMFVIFSIILKRGRQKVASVAKGTIVQSEQDFVKHGYDLSGKTFRGEVSLDGVKYKAYQTVEGSDKPILKNENVIVEAADNHHLVVRTL